MVISFAFCLWIIDYILKNISKCLRMCSSIVIQFVCVGGIFGCFCIFKIFIFLWAKTKANRVFLIPSIWYILASVWCMSTTHSFLLQASYNTVVHWCGVGLTKGNISSVAMLLNRFTNGRRLISTRFKSTAHRVMHCGWYIERAPYLKDGTSNCFSKSALYQYHSLYVARKTIKTKADKDGFYNITFNAIFFIITMLRPHSFPTSFPGPLLWSPSN